jgi:hypothetical protein
MLKYLPIIIIKYKIPSISDKASDVFAGCGQAVDGKQKKMLHEN